MTSSREMSSDSEPMKKQNPPDIEWREIVEEANMSNEITTPGEAENLISEFDLLVLDDLSKWEIETDDDYSLLGEMFDESD